MVIQLQENLYDFVLILIKSGLRSESTDHLLHITDNSIEWSY